MDKKIVSNHQLFTVSALSIIGGSILVISSTVTGVAKQDAWISALISIVLGLCLVWLYCFLNTRYPGLTFFGMMKRILGKWVGSVVAFGYLFFFFTMSYGVPWWIGSFGAHVMHETPVPVILLPYIVALIVAVYYDIEAIVRASEVLYVLVTTFLVVTVVLVLPNAKINYILPILENGIAPVLKGTYLLSSFIVFPALGMMMIYPVNCSDIAGGKKAILKGFLWCGIVTFVIMTASILVLGVPVVAKSAYPTILLAREIKIGTVLTRLEYIISMMWTITEFMIGLIFFYAFVKGLAELLGLKEHKRMAFPAGLIVLAYAWIVNPSNVEAMNWNVGGFVPEATVFGFVLPLVMLGAYIVRGGKKRRDDSEIRKEPDESVPTAEESG